MSRALPRPLFVALDERLASTRVRVHALLPWLARAGVQARSVPYPHERAAWRTLAEAARAATHVVVQKKLPSWLDARRWKALERPLVFDFDDALPFRQRAKHGRWQSATRARRFRRALDAVDAVAAGSSELAALCEEFHGGFHGPLAVLPSAVPLDVPRRDGPLREPARIGWIGGSGNLGELEAIGPALARLAARRSVRLVVISDGAPRIPGVELELVRWSAEGQAAALAALDVGLMPLADTPWTRGKCAYKALQTMAAGVPVVLSPVGMNARLVRDGENGLFAKDPDAWDGVLERLLSDGELHGRLARAGRATVEAQFGYETVAANWLTLLERIPSGAR